MSERRSDETMEAYVIRLVREDEREKCAKIAERVAVSYSVYPSQIEAATRVAIAAAIRALPTTEPAKAEEPSTSGDDGFQIGIG